MDKYNRFIRLLPIQTDIFNMSTKIVNATEQFWRIANEDAALKEAADEISDETAAAMLDTQDQQALDMLLAKYDITDPKKHNETEAKILERANITETMITTLNDRLKELIDVPVKVIDALKLIQEKDHTPFKDSNYFIDIKLERLSFEQLTQKMFVRNIDFSMFESP